MTIPGRDNIAVGLAKGPYFIDAFHEQGVPG